MNNMFRSKNRQGILNSVQDLIDSASPDSAPEELYVGEFNSKDIWDEYKHTFDKEVVTAIEKLHVDSLLHQYNEYDNEELYDLATTLKRLKINDQQTTDTTNFFGHEVVKDDVFDPIINSVMATRKISPIQFLGCRVRDESEIAENVEKLHKRIKKYVDMGFIRGHLTKMMYIPYQIEEEGGAIVSYLAFSEEGANYIKENKPDESFNEGDRPKFLED